MRTEKKILICGAGIAGPACAYWLDHHGFSVVIAERAKALRDGGQNVDIKGAAQQIIFMMGIAGKIAAKDTMEQGVKCLDESGNIVAVFPKGGYPSLTADFEILRGDLAQIMFEATQDRCEYRFGTFVTALEETSDGITVIFNDGRVEAFELVICAEGISSSTRKMVLPEQTHFRYLGAYMSFFNIPQRSEDDNWARSVSGTGGTLVTLRPGKNHETTVLTTFLREDHGFEEEDAATRKALVARALEGRGTVAERVRSELDQVSDFWCGPMSQVQASRWAKGRFVMIGDAAYCPTPFTGEGAALALIGAYVLAGELKCSSGFEDAFSTYEKLVRPHVEKSQKRLSPTVIRALHMKTQFGLTFFRLVQRLVTSRVSQRLLKPSDAKRNARVAKDFVFPRYT